MTASLVGRLGQVRFIISFPLFGIKSLVRVKLLFAVIVGPVLSDRCMHVSDPSRSARLSLALQVVQQRFSASSLTRQCMFPCTRGHRPHPVRDDSIIDLWRFISCNILQRSLTELGIVCPHAVHDDNKLSSDGDDRTPSAFVSQQTQAPGLDLGTGDGSHHHGVRCCIERGSNIGIACLWDAAGVIHLS